MQSLLSRYALEIDALTASESTREETFYPAIRNLLAGLLLEERLPFEVRTSTSEYLAACTFGP
jgi:hypothetical protein